MKKLTIYYKQAMFKGLSEKNWIDTEISDFSRGKGCYILDGLDRGTLYRMYVVASNDFGDSPQSSEIWFRTVATDIEKRTT